MPRKPHKHTSFYTYLAPFLESGDERAIASAKKEYRRKYKASWRKQKRKRVKEITTSWEKEEYKTLKEEAKGHHEKLARFIKRIAIAYMNKRYVVPEEVQVTKVIQLLASVFNSISELMEETNVPAEAGRKVLSDLQNLEHDIRVTLYSPKTIEEHIEKVLKERTGSKTNLITFIQNLPV